MQIYQVGGAVRDELLGFDVKDRDWVVVGATPEQMTALGYKAVGRDFPVFIHSETGEEYALARTERKTGPGYTGFAFDTSEEVTLEQDLERRDITINAIARDGNGNLIDPFNGRKDLEEKIIRHVSAAFVEDPLRVLRVARFAAQFNFAIAGETQSLLKEISATDELETLAPERVWTETEKALQTAQPRRYFEVLRECAALAKLFPEIDRLFGVPQPERHHPEIDSGVHTLMVLEQATAIAGDPEVRFAALVHDLGKGTTPQQVLPKHHGHEERGVALINNLCDRLRIPNRYRDLAVLVSRYHLHCHRIRELKPATVLRALEGLDALRRTERFDLFLLACTADARGRKGMEQQDYPQADLFRKYREACLAVTTNSEDIQGLKGAGIADYIRAQRLEAIKEVKAQEVE
ncbi:MAG: multifunctional CCA addition/repair protein [Gammaproteobacteria bacterium]|nr:multifunctional CCA addition/repair protein [Gammaproteobacteria bacterium]